MLNRDEEAGTKWADNQIEEQKTTKGEDGAT